ncbi:hypothetical protein ACIP46_07975 [Streptomyces lavendulae]|uniref:hypothetical protein n=1 Tax=Streptomyces lavendulae TaxID=1914 RepID=UPI00380CEE20
MSEYGSGLIRTTMVAVPARHAVVPAKAVVLAAVWTAVGTVISPAAFLVSQAVLGGRHAGVPLTRPGVARALVASALLAPACALVGMGLGALIRHTPGSVAATLFTLVMLPPLFSTSRQWSADVNHVMVVSAWKRLVQNWGGTSPASASTTPRSPDPGPCTRCGRWSRSPARWSSYAGATCDRGPGPVRPCPAPRLRTGCVRCG